jgi:hypothetical protein
VRQKQPPDGAVAGFFHALSRLRRPRIVHRGELRFELALDSRWSRWHPIGSIEIGAPLPLAEAEALRFDPWNCGGGLEPAGLPNSLAC